MPSVLSTPANIDQEWAGSLEKLRLNVPSKWWNGCTGNDLNAGTIVGVDFDRDDDAHFQFELDSELGAIYPMRYDAVFLYADEDQPGYSKFHLPSRPPANPANESARVARRRVQIQPRRVFRNDSDDDDISHKRQSKRQRCHANDSEDDDEMEEQSISSSEEEEEDPTHYTKTNAEDWKVVKNGRGARRVEPVPYTGESEEFGVNITDEELNSLKDENGDIRFYKVLDWLLPRFEDETFFEWVAARMRNYMVHLIREFEWKPQYYKPDEDKVILGDHVARFFGCQSARMLRGSPQIEKAWSTREPLDAVGTCKESMPMHAFMDMHRCIHFADDWEEGEDDADWDNVYLDDKHNSPDSAQHRRKYGDVEDAFNKRWKECVTTGKHLTFDESRVAGWYHSPQTIGPEPKPIRTGATLHSLCITKGPLASYKLHVRTYGGKTDEDLGVKSTHTGTVQKFVNLLDIMLDDFKDNGHHVTMDSAYMGDIMAQIGQYEWLINMVGTTQTDRTGADIKAEVTELRKKLGSYETVCFQHKEMPLCVAAWADNNVVRTLSNYHWPEILPEEDGLMRKKRGENGKREKSQSPVSCPRQVKDYCETFHLIDKGNKNEAKYDMGGQSKKHNWSPKLVFRLFNMTLNNAYKIYSALVEEYTPGKRYLDMGEGIKEMTHALASRGETMRERRAEHPAWLRPLSSVFAWMTGRKIRKDAHGEISGCGQQPNKALSRLAILRKRQKKSTWRTHQSLAYERKGKCAYEHCPGLKNTIAKRARSYDTFMRCEECSALFGKDVFLCNNTKSGKPVICHLAYHGKYHNKQYDNGE